MKKYKNKNSGFTLVETLSVVAIMVILLAFGIVGIVRYRDYLKITEMDNMAREIYMAAQNRAVLLQNSGRLKSELSETGAESIDISTLPSDITEGTSYITWAGTAIGMWDELLPVGTIDPALRDGKFYIVYEPTSGSVTDVFFAENDNLPATINKAFDLADEGRNARMKKGPMLGWHHGDPAGLIDTKPLPAPGVEIIIVNGEELTLTVTFTMPEDLPSGLNPENLGRTPVVRLEYGGEQVELLKVDDTGIPILILSGERLVSTSGNIKSDSTATYTWVLDSLEQDGSNNYTRQFRGLFSPGTGDAFGDDFTVTAGLKLTASGYIDSAYYPRATDNSLFAKGTNYSDTGVSDDTGNDIAAHTALIANLRHLQNLRVIGTAGAEPLGFSSGVGDGIHMAEQLCDIDCEQSRKNDRAPLNEAYKFIPVKNNNLRAYDGKNNHIYSLSTLENADAAGLFGTVSGTLEIRNCRVCWENPEKLVTTTTPGEYIYAVSGTNAAGGLIGSVSGTVTINNSFAATTVKGSEAAGGLIGSVTGGAVTITNSYADCYLKAETAAGGLAGSNTGTISLNSCYAAGFIVKPSTGTTTAGLVNGTANAEKTYSAVRIIKDDGTPDKPKTQLYNDVTANDVFYLARKTDVTEAVVKPALGDTFEYDDDKPETHVYDLRYRISDPGNETLKLEDRIYPFPALKYTVTVTNEDGTTTEESRDLPHYCDWAELKEEGPAGLAYYEEYSRKYNGNMGYGECEYGVAGWYESASIDTGLPGDDAIKYEHGAKSGVYSNLRIVRDGYALVFEGDRVPSGSYKIKYGDSNVQEWTLLNGSLWTLNVPEGGSAATQVVETFEITRTTGGETKIYTLIPLPDDVVTGVLPEVLPEGDSYAAKYYQKLETVTALTENARSFCFNPHFAKTVKVETAPAEPTGSEDSAISVRTPRHFYDLSRTYTYSEEKTCNYFNRGYYFKQELDIDYETYTGYSNMFSEPAGGLPFKQDPVGIGQTDVAAEAAKKNDPFRGTYDGGCHVIRNVFFNIRGAYLGIFGLCGYQYSATDIAECTVKNVVYEMDPTKCETVEPGDNSRSIGALVGKNYGTVKNCAVYGVNMRAKGKYIGGLVGYNQKEVTNCAAEVACLTVTLKAAEDTTDTYAGGLVGRQNKDDDPNNKITTSYAVGKLVKSGESDKSGIITGLTGCKGIVTNCYAAVNLVSDCDAADSDDPEIYGLTQVTNGANVTGSGWFKDAFVYRGEKYNNEATINKYGDSGIAMSLDGLENILNGFQFKVNEGNTVRNIPELDKIPKGVINYTTTYDGKDFPYLTGVKDKDLTAAGGEYIHYGLWPVPLPVGLTYYEKYSVNYKLNWYGVAGEYEGMRIDTELPDDSDINENTPLQIKKDGYALVFEGEDVPAGDYMIEYGNGIAQPWTLNVSFETGSEGNRIYKGNWTTNKDSEFEPFTVYRYKKDENGNLVADVEGKPVIEITYTLFPLPDAVVTGALSEGDKDTTKFYQKLVYHKGMYGERDFYFNPHFAKTVESGKDADGNDTVPDEPKNSKKYIDNNGNEATINIKDTATIGLKWSENAISVRTPRHFNALSRFQHTYVEEESKYYPVDGNLLDTKRYYFRQELNLDYKSYDWYGYTPDREMEEKVVRYYLQTPVGLGTTDNGFKGVYDGGGHTIRNVFYNTNVIEGTQYIGLFRYVEYLWDTTYEVPDGAVANLGTIGMKPPNSPGVFNNYHDEIRVGTLAGGAFRAINCTARMNDLTITSERDYTDIFVGGLLGYTNRTAGCHAVITGCLSVEGNGEAENVHVGGMQGLIWYDAPDSTSIVNSLRATAKGDCYGGGLLGRSTDNAATWAVSEPCRQLLNCSAAVGTLYVTSTGSGRVYGGGLAGWCDEMINCGAVVTGSVIVEGTGNSVYGGGLAGGGTDIRSSFAVARSVKCIRYGQSANTETYIGYVGGLAGEARKMQLTYTGANQSILQIQNSYAAAAELQGNTKGAVYGKSDITPSNCYYLDGGANSWNFMDMSYSGNSNYTTNNGVTGKTYDELADLASILGTSWGKAQNNAYPFPVSTIKGSRYYPVNIWPNKNQAVAFYTLSGDDVPGSDGTGNDESNEPGTDMTDKPEADIPKTDGSGDSDGTGSDDSDGTGPDDSDGAGPDDFGSDVPGFEEPEVWFNDSGPGDGNG